MFQDHPAWVAHQRKHWVRPDAHNFVRPNAYRFMPPGSPRYLGKEAVRYFWPKADGELRAAAHERKHDAHGHDTADKHSLDLSALQASILRLRREVDALRIEFKWRRFFQGLKAYNPNQPRVPAGNPDGGQWTHGGTGLGEGGGGQAKRGDGHHFVPHAVYDKLPLPPEARKVFDDAKTGALYDTSSNKYDADHRIYNSAVQELFERFVARNNIRVEQMTPDQAHQFVREVMQSKDLRIRNFNNNILIREIMKRLPRWPRGNE